ncbi:hypothetical protein UFOVP943_5 [uncultured Caudovirales phage]|uniref:Uncharacterized protein n=1 Tax=uncultured Caudovirales phage TaxID=2100421 RepID=A0A6J5QXJ0_9CAUD|nr:hypothetical protein UFOVP943_5 [uncultured Caudovirales phage]CAB4184334.1 hypothetical protein UFOVP1111_53 [uncultured Caudovirales phage]CAB4203249.1 hypothetical protein UFOVP1380_5 [uncultured Caudovirales phage]
MATQPKQHKYAAVNLLNTFTAGTNEQEMADMLGISRSCVVRWRTINKTLYEYQADMYAIRLGFHPAEIWHNWLDDAMSIA